MLRPWKELEVGKYWRGIEWNAAENWQQNKYNFCLLSGPNDHVFINFVDHGAPGLWAFPDSELHARELQDAIVDMNRAKRYGKLVMYIEACESGSLFENKLSDDLNGKEMQSDFKMWITRCLPL